MEKIINVGFISPLTEEKICELIQNHYIFSSHKLNLIRCQYTSELKEGLRINSFDYAIVPCRNKDNNINLDMMDMVSSMVVNNLIEIGSFTLEDSFDEKVVRNQTEEFVDRDPVNSYNDSEYLKGKTKKHKEKFEYKIFKTASYKTSWFKKLCILLFANGIFDKIFTVVLTICSILAIVFAFTLGKENPMDNITLWITLSIAVLQLVVNLSKIHSKVINSLITGYWIYYSFEESNENNSFVPKGFKTRLLQIKSEGKDLNFVCSFEGEDSLFFSTLNTTFDYSSKEKVGKGFYEYTTNTLNNKGKRAEGICRYQGISVKNTPFQSMDGWFSSRGTEITGRVKYVRVTEEEFNILNKSSGFYKNSFEQDEVKHIGVFGDQKSNTDLAAHKWVEKMKLENESVYVYFDSIEKMLESGIKRSIDYAVVPEQNRGLPITKNLIFKKNGNTPIDEVENEIKYVLASSKENFIINSSTIFIGHTQSLIQCEKFIGKNRSKEISSSSKAARELKYYHDPNKTVAICNEEAARFYHLFILKNKDGQPINPYIGEEKNITVFRVYDNSNLNKKK